MNTGKGAAYVVGEENLKKKKKKKKEIVEIPDRGSYVASTQPPRYKVSWDRGFHDMLDWSVINLYTYINIFALHIGRTATVYSM